MPTTTKMGIVYPASTDLVKDGATAMGTISTTVDAKTGLVLLNTTTFSAVSSQSINSVFNSSFDNYRIQIRITASSTANAHRMRMRASGADDTGANYFFAGSIEYFNSGTLLGDNVNAGDNFALGGGTASSTGMGYIIELLSPNLTQKTIFAKQATGENTTYAYHAQATGVHNLTNAYDGFSIIASTGTISGTVYIFGYNK